MKSPKILARIAGLFYLIVVLCGVFAHLVVRSAIVVLDDAAVTTANIAANPDLYRTALASDIVMAIAFVGLGVTLHRLLGHVHRAAGVAMLVWVSVGAGLILLNLAFHAASLAVATDASAISAFGEAGSQALVLLLVQLHANGYLLAGVFFGLWLLPLGFLALRSGLFPRLLGWLLIAGGASYLIDIMLTFLVPALPQIVHDIIGLPAYAEMWVVLYLLIVGVRRSRIPAADSPSDAAQAVTR